MSYQFVLDLLSKMIEEKEKEGPFRRSTTTHYLVKVLYKQQLLETLFRDYLKTKEDSTYVDLFSCANFTYVALFRIIENNDLPENLIFTIRTLIEVNDPLQDMMTYVDEKTPTLEEVLKISNFISKNVEDILSTIPHEFEPKGTDFNEDAMSWWRNR